MRRYAIPAALAAVAVCTPAAEAAKLRTMLPLVTIRAAKPIPDDPKVAARIRVIDRPGRRANRTSDPGNVYAGGAGIELRGHSSQLFPKKQYGVELRDRRGEGRDVSLLGMAADDDWVLSASYSDKTLMRNALAYRTARRVFGRWAPRTRHVEVMLNGRYRGVYALTQRIGLGDGRVETGDNGWILELVFGYQAFGERRFRSPRTGRPLLYTDPDDPGRRQARAIRRDVTRFERALYGKRFRHPRRGWRAHADPAAAVDYVLLQELLGNQDAFHASTYFHRSRGEIVFGPLWDFDIAMGNTTLDRFRTPPGWHLGQRPYAERLYRDRGFVRAMAQRWRDLRRAGLRRKMLSMVASDARLLRGAQARNFNRWRILGRYVWPNPVDPRTGRYRPSWRSEVAYLRRWLAARIAWIDRALPARARRMG
jgi:hypothetical protein